MISFDGDQTLYSDGGNFEDNDELASAIILLLKNGVKVALITAAGYGCKCLSSITDLSMKIITFVH